MADERIRKLKPLALGISSITADPNYTSKFGAMLSKHIPLMDFDRRFDAGERKRIEKHNYGLIRVILTPNGYHLYFLSVLVSFKKYLKMLEDLKADKGFIAHTKFRGYGNLRISPYFGIRTKHFKEGGHIGAWATKTPQGEIIDKILDRVVV